MTSLKVETEHGSGNLLLDEKQLKSHDELHIWDWIWASLLDTSYQFISDWSRHLSV